MTGAWVIHEGAAGGMIRPATYCKPSQQGQLPIIHRALFERLADVAVMGAQLMGDLVDRKASIAESTSNLSLLRAKALASNLDPIEKNAVNGVPFCDHGSSFSWLRVRGAASTPFAHRGLLFLLGSGAVSPGPDISQVSGPSFLQDAQENCKPSSLLTVSAAVICGLQQVQGQLFAPCLARFLAAFAALLNEAGFMNSNSPGTGGCVPGAFPVPGCSTRSGVGVAGRNPRHLTGG